MYSLSVALTFLCEGAHFSIFPVTAVKIFGIQNGGKIFTIMFFAVPLSSNFGLLMVKVVQQYIGPANIFRVAGCMSLINFVLLYYFDESPIVKSEMQKLKDQRIFNFKENENSVNSSSRERIKHSTVQETE